MLRMIIHRWKVIVPVVCVYAAVLGYWAQRAQALALANEELAGEMSRVARSGHKPERLVLLEEENAGLERNVSAIRELREEAQRLRTEVAEEARESAEAWAARSNELQMAIEKERGELMQLAEWEREWRRAKMEAAAAARLVEKAEMNLDPARERERTGAILRAIAMTTKERMESQRAWREGSDKSPEALRRHRSNSEEISARWLEATEALGADKALYEQLPVKLEELDDVNAVLFRSVLPDRQGMSVTVFLNGEVRWAQIQ